jgi:hypothetical protein
MEYQNKLALVRFFVFLRLLEVNFRGYKKQKTHNFRCGFAFAEKEGLSKISFFQYT